MFRKLSLLALLVLFCLSANANTLCKRKRLQGTFDLDGIVRQLNMTVAKHLNNIQHLNASVDPGIEEQNALVIQRVEGQVPLVIQGQTQQVAGSLPLTGKSLVGNVLIGDKQFRIRFDTGSSDTWVTSSLCTSKVCENKNKYDAARSPTQDPPGTSGVKYADGSSISGEVKIDTVNVAGVVATDQFIIAATTLSDEFAEKEYDGMIGMAMTRDRSGLNKDPFFITATKQDKDILEEFAFKLAAPASIYLGGTDETLYTGDIEKHALADSGPSWKINGASVSVGEVKVASGLRAIIDTGSDIILAPPAEVAEFYAKIPGSEICQESGYDFYFFPCPVGQPIPSISFSWPGGRSWPIGDNFVRLVAPDDPAGRACAGNIAGRDFGHGEKVWLLGDPFLKSVYTVFLPGEDSVGFAQLK